MSDPTFFICTNGVAVRLRLIGLSMYPDGTAELAGEVEVDPEAARWLMAAHYASSWFVVDAGSIGHACEACIEQLTIAHRIARVNLKAIQWQLPNGAEGERTGTISGVGDLSAFAGGTVRVSSTGALPAGLSPDKDYVLVDGRLVEPLDVEYDGVSLRDLLEADRARRQENDVGGIIPWRNVRPWTWTPAQRAAVSAHWSAQLRLKRQAAERDTRVVLDCAEEL